MNQKRKQKEKEREFVKELEHRGRGPSAFYFWKKECQINGMDDGKKYRIIIRDYDAEADANEGKDNDGEVSE